MALGLVVNRNQASASRYIGDLAALFERRRLDVGQPAGAEQFEVLLSASSGFRSELLTLLNAISLMSENDLSPEQMLDLISGALAVSPLPESLCNVFRSALDQWKNRDQPAFGSSRANPAGRFEAGSDPESISASAPASEFSAKVVAIPRPAGVPTLQEALNTARIRGGNKPLHPSSDQEDRQNTAEVDELTDLLQDIQQRMQRLQPELRQADTPVAPSRTAEQMEDDFLHRHSYLLPRVPIHERLAELEREQKVQEAQKELEDLRNAVIELDGDPELRLAPHASASKLEHAVSSRRVKLRIDMAALRRKQYLGVVLLGVIVLIGGPLAGMLAYRYLHPPDNFEQPSSISEPAAPVAAPAAPAPAHAATPHPRKRKAVVQSSETDSEADQGLVAKPYSTPVQ